MHGSVGVLWPSSAEGILPFVCVTRISNSIRTTVTRWYVDMLLSTELFADVSVNVPEALIQRLEEEKALTERLELEARQKRVRCVAMLIVQAYFPSQRYSAQNNLSCWL